MSSAEIATGITSVVVAFLGVVTDVLWGSASTVYVNCKCCSSSGSGPVVTVGDRTPKEKWLPIRMASNARVTSPTPEFATTVESQAIVSSVTAGLKRMSWMPIPTATCMTLRLTVDGRSYLFKTCATSTHSPRSAGLRHLDPVRLMNNGTLQGGPTTGSRTL